ncbi:DUF4395 family protein [Anaerolineales bacterium]
MSAGKNTLRKVDHSGLKTGMVLTIVLLLIAFIVNSWVLVAFVALCQFLGAIQFPYAPYRLIYEKVVKASGYVKANIIEDNPEPHRFAMLVGAIFNALASIALISGNDITGWVLVAIVVILANLNLWVNFCLGCWFYYQFNRLGIPGFKQAPI